MFRKQDLRIKADPRLLLRHLALPCIRSVFGIEDMFEIQPLTQHLKGVCGYSLTATINSTTVFNLVRLREEQNQPTFLLFRFSCLPRSTALLSKHRKSLPLLLVSAMLPLLYKNVTFGQKYYTIQSMEESSTHKWSLRMHVET